MLMGMFLLDLLGHSHIDDDGEWNVLLDLFDIAAQMMILMNLFSHASKAYGEHSTI